MAEPPKRKHWADDAQPRGLWVLFVTELWERFSYYGMRALLVLYLVTKTSEGNPGFGWTEESATMLYGWYTGLVYLTPIAGGWLADRLLGTHRSVLVGGWIIAAGHFCLAGTEFFASQAVSAVTWDSAPAALLTFLTGLLLIIIGTGFFKPCISVMVGQLYDEGDPRRDSGFTIFYIGINVGAFLSGLVAGTLGEKVGWHWGFASAGVGMVLGLAIYQLFRHPYLEGIGLPPGKETAAGAGPPAETSPERETPAEHEQYPLTRVEIDRMAVVLVLAIFAIVFWVAFEQAGSSLNLFALDRTDRSLPWLEALLPAGWYGAISPFPATWYQSVNPAAIIIFAPVFAWLWLRLDRYGLQPSTPVKFGLGLMLLSLGFVVMIFAALQADRRGLAGPSWLLVLYVLITWGELCLSPVGLSMVTKLSPARFQSLMMGLYFATYFVSNVTAGYVAALSNRVERGELFTLLGGQADFFLFLALIPFVVGVIVLVVSPKLKRMMHGLQ